MRRLHTDGTVLITNHDQPEAVILATSAYAALLERAQQGEARIETDLAHLRRRFDERMAALEKPDAGERLRSIMRGPTTLRGKVKAGTTY
jgi:PHD/YefM family antitoxin component YafN of YafNO toxin-antitoxin module